MENVTGKPHEVAKTSRVPCHTVAPFSLRETVDNSVAYL